MNGNEKKALGHGEGTFMAVWAATCKLVDTEGPTFYVLMDAWYLYRYAMVNVYG